MKKRLYIGSLVALFGIQSICLAQNGNIGTLDDRCSSQDFSLDGEWGRYPVQEGCTTGGSTLDPRIERKLSPKIDIGDKMTYQATYNIVAANNSTIAQVLNQDTRTSDAYKPVVFIIADDKGSFWSLRDQQVPLFDIPKNSANKTPTFRLRIDTYYNSANTVAYSKVYIDGVLKETKQHARVGQSAEMRYGNYHHGSGLAIIRVKDVSWQTTSSVLTSNDSQDAYLEDLVNKISAFPSPSTTGIFNLTASTDWQVFNGIGQLIEKGTGDLIDLSNFQKGLYNVKTKNKSFIVLYE